MRSRPQAPIVTAIRKFFVSAFVIFAFSAYAIHERLIDFTPPTTSSETTAAFNLLPTLPPTLVPDSKQIASQDPKFTLIPPTDVPFVAPTDIPSTDIPFVAPTNIPFVAPTSIPPTDVPYIPPTAIPPTNTPQGQYRDGTYTGPDVDAYYGSVEVQAVIQNGQIANITFLDYPQDRRTSQRINAVAVPDLTQETLQAQSAQVDVISGATLTSQAFIQSLGNALDQARN